jgi:hypothetical protein
LFDQTLPSAMEGLHIDLLNRTQGDNAHAGHAGYLSQGSGIVKIVLLRLYEGAHMLSWDQSNIVPMAGSDASEVLGPAAGLHRQNAARVGGKEPMQLLASELLAQHHASEFVETDRVEYSLANVDP